MAELEDHQVLPYARIVEREQGMGIIESFYWVLMFRMNRNNKCCGKGLEVMHGY